MRLIDADALREWLKTIPLKDLSDGLGLCLVIMENDFRKAIKNMPEECIIDAEPVRHGHWITNEGFDGDEYYSCSACGCDWFCPEGTPHDNNMKYCPECGAKMDEEVSQ